MLKTDGMPTELYDKIDDSDIREWLGCGDGLFWIPTIYLLVSPLTKHYPLHADPRRLHDPLP
eukprot:9172260-Heterocapsa_arctica.AAC.1